MTELHFDLEPFIETTYYRAIAFAYSMVAHRPTPGFAAEDITQAAYERLLIKLKRDPAMLERFSVEQMTTFLLSIIRYLGYELSRSSQYFAEIDLIDVDLDGDQDIQALALSTNVETLVLANDAKLNLLRRIRALPERQRNIIELKLEGYSHEEIAAQLLISLGAVKTALHRARQSLYFWLKEDNQPETVSCQEEASSPDREKQALIALIKRLPDPYRIVVELRLVKHMSYKDIAKMLHKNVGTVKSQVSRGRQLLANPQCGHTKKKKPAKAKVTAAIYAELTYKVGFPDFFGGRKVEDYLICSS